MERRLTIIAGPNKGDTFPLAENASTVIGRGEGSDIRMKDPRVSRIHCQLHVENNRVVLADAGSSGGTFVNGERVTQRELVETMVFQIGDSQIRYELNAAQSADTIVTPVPERKPVSSAPGTLSSLIGQSLAHFELEKILHKGNTSMVFRARDTKQGRLAAVKVIDPQIAANDEERERFVRAVNTMINVRHANLVEIYNAGKQGPFCWCAMEYIDGPSIMEVIDLIGIQGMLDWRESFRVAVHVTRALHCAYENKIIHRNVTPQNLLQRKGDKVVKLADLMLAKALEGTNARQVTSPGQMVGDLAFMSPERTHPGSDVDGRSDIYGLGATLYALLTGRPPFEKASVVELVRAVREEDPVPPKEIQLAVDDRFQDLVLKMLAKNPDDRYQRPLQILQELEHIGKFQGVDADAAWPR
ncbi:MAG: serine/threonine-protein kinase [Pirellulaceae bacterium]|nr:serine/threonine-protein kinase [Pirellulaceae bacterium]